MRQYDVGDRVVFYEWLTHHMRARKEHPGTVMERLPTPHMLMPEYRIKGDDGVDYYGDWCDMRPEGEP